MCTVFDVATDKKLLVCPYQFYVCELLGDSEGVVADGQHVSLDGRLGLRFKSCESLSCSGVDLDQSLLVLAEHRQPPDQALAHLADRLPVNLLDEPNTINDSSTKLKYMKGLYTWQALQIVAKHSSLHWAMFFNVLQPHAGDMWVEAVISLFHYICLVMKKRAPTDNNTELRAKQLQSKSPVACTQPLFSSAVGVNHPPQFCGTTKTLMQRTTRTLTTFQQDWTKHLSGHVLGESLMMLCKLPAELLKSL